VHTTRTISSIVGAVAMAILGVQVALVAVLGLWPGIVVGAGLAAVVITHYGLTLRPWHRRWGATDAEVHAVLPGDELVADASSTTRAVAIAAPPEAVWPWLVQIGWGRGGWYSYDWIDNDGRPSADTIVPDWQHLGIGDRIAMTPDQGFVVQQLEPPRLLVALSDDGSTSWCLRVEADGDGSRLVSRFTNHTRLTPLSALWLLVVDPGVFIMERKMLLGIAARAEAAWTGGGTASVTAGAPAPSRDGCAVPSIVGAEAFLDGGRIAVIGASEEKGNMGGVILHELRRHGHEVIPIHPTAAEVGGQRCYPTIGDVRDPIDGAIVVVPAAAAVDVVRQCIDAGVHAIWLFKGLGGGGAASDEAVSLCREAGIEVVPGACPLMFLHPVGSIHRIHRMARTARGNLVRSG